MVDGIDYDAWRSQFSTPIDGGGGMGTAAASGSGAAMALESNQTISVSSFLDASNARLEGKDTINANDEVFGTLLLSRDRWGASLRRSKERLRSLAPTLPRDWTELLNDLAERKVHRGATNESAPANHSSSRQRAESTDAATPIDCSVAKTFASI
jgi:hypothetical protein